MSMKILFFFGTRPEAIKLVPLVCELRRHPDMFDCAVCVSAQHRHMLDQVLSFFCASSDDFCVSPDFDLNIMKPAQSLLDITVNALSGLGKAIEEYRPDMLIVQGDTTSTFAGALAAFYAKIRIAHIEAGLRSFNKYSPFPEEINRLLTARLSDLHFAPTDNARRNLIKENIPESDIFVVGNTSIDALFLCLELLKPLASQYMQQFKMIDFGKKIILVTGHRRESFGVPFENICNALKALSETEEVEIVYPVHLNPNVRKPVFEILSGLKQVHLVEPLDYPSFVWLMNRSDIILTDSGGVQEEAPSLGKPVLVMRDVTERTEGIDAGTAMLVGTDMGKIVTETRTLLHDSSRYLAMANAVNPYGDGTACLQIRQILSDILLRG